MCHGGVTGWAPSPGTPRSPARLTCPAAGPVVHPHHASSAPASSSPGFRAVDLIRHGGKKMRFLVAKSDVDTARKIRFRTPPP